MKWRVSAEDCAKDILSYPFRRIILIKEKDRPCSMCSKLGTTVEVLLNEKETKEINPNAMYHFGPRCWKLVKKLIS